MLKVLLNNSIIVLVWVFQSQKSIRDTQRQKLPLKRMKKTSGFEVFCMEFHNKNPQFDRVSVVEKAGVAWGQCSEEARNGYMEKAERINAEEEQKIRHQTHLY